VGLRVARATYAEHTSSSFDVSTAWCIDDQGAHPPESGVGAPYSEG
jgi:hypothetical protein